MFKEEDFLLDLENNLEYRQHGDFDCFDNILENTLNWHAPVKTKIVRGNNKPHISKSLRKAIMVRSKLKNIANKTGHPDDISKFKRQRNRVVNINKKEKRSFFSKIECNNNSNKRFWSTFKPYLSNKSHGAQERILLLRENNNIISEDKDVATTFNDYFSNITSSLDIKKWNVDYKNVNDNAVISAIEKYSTHPSIIMIKAKYPHSSKFNFKHILPENTCETIMKLKTSKKCSGNIPTHILKLTVGVITNALTDCINCAIDDGTFPNSLKCADIIPIHKKDDKLDKSNYRPVSLLPIISKVYEKLILDQIASFFNSKFSSLLGGFRKKYSTQHSLFNLLQNWQKYLDKSEIIGTILMDLSKAYDVLSHELLIAKLEAYGFSLNSLKLLYSYLSNRKQRVRIESIFSEWIGIVLGVPQGSILGPILFNIFINDMFFFLLETEVCNFADDNTLYIGDSCLDKVVIKLENDISRVIKWFNFNSMVVNPAKFQLMFLGQERKPRSKYCIDIDGNIIPEQNEIKLLGVTIDQKLNFDSHVKSFCKKANQKVRALRRIRTFINFKSAKLIYNAYILSAFSYCPLIWTFCGKSANGLINNTHLRALKMIYKSENLSLEDILHKDLSVKIHTKNLQLLMLEVYKSRNKLNPEFMWDLFRVK